MSNYFFLLLTCLLSNLAVGQDAPFARPVIKRFGLDEGMPHRSNYSAAYDRDSMLWLSTESSLCRFDGYDITSYPQFTQRFNGVLRRGDSTLLYASPMLYPDSVEVFDPISKQAFGTVLSRGLPGRFAGISQRESAPLYFAQGSAIYRFRPGSAPKVVHELSAEIRSGDALIAADENTYYLFRNKNNTLEEFRSQGQVILTHLPPNSERSTFHVAKNGVLWLGTPNGLLHKTAGGSDLAPVEGLLGTQSINRIYEDQKGKLIFCYQEDNVLRTRTVWSYDNGIVHSLSWLIKLDNRITNFSGTDFYQEINLSTHGGFVRVSFPDNEAIPFKRHLYDPAVPSGGFGHVMRGFTADDEGNVYTNKDTRQPHWYRVNYPDFSVDTLTMRDEKGEVVDHYGCGTNMLNYQGDIFGSSCSFGAKDTAHVYRYRPADDSWYRWELPAYNERIRWMMLTGKPGEMLIFTQCEDQKRGKIFYFYPKEGRFQQVLPAGINYGIRGYTKKAVMDTLKQQVWLASSGGLHRFDLTTDSLHYYPQQSERKVQLSDVQIRKNGHLLLGSFKEGLLLFTPATRSFTNVGGIPIDEDPVTQSSDFLQLPSNDVASFGVTNKGSFIVATFNGLSIHGNTEGPSSTYTMVDGLPSNEFNTPSLFYNKRDSNWYAGGINGFVSFRTEDLIRRPSPFSPLLLRIRFLDDDVGREQSSSLRPAENPQLVIPPSVSYFYIDYTLPDYSPKRAPRYQTRLVGLDDKWRTPTPSNTVRYTRLPSGKYTFQLRAIDADGRQTSKIRQLSILVETPWNKTWWFYGLLFLTVTVLAGGYLWNRERRIRKEYRARRQIQDLEMKMLRQQINPHFISNAMNAIRDIVYEKDSAQAGEYLTDFSRLMRLFLEASRSRFTAIRDEADLLKRYIRLEQLRFPGKFDYRITIDPDIESDMDEVPSLVLQPIVENAINHGLYHLDGGGLLEINIALDPADEETIVVTITDNGVGRERAFRLRSSSPDHVSRATEILNDRQKLLAEDGTVTMRVVTTDLHSDKQHTGTVVTVRIEPVEARVG